jgi:hypothetical protein
MGRDAAAGISLVDNAVVDTVHNTINLNVFRNGMFVMNLLLSNFLTKQLRQLI